MVTDFSSLIIETCVGFASSPEGEGPRDEASEGSRSSLVNKDRDNGY